MQGSLKGINYVQTKVQKEVWKEVYKERWMKGGKFGNTEGSIEGSSNGRMYKGVERSLKEVMGVWKEVQTEGNLKGSSEVQSKKFTGM